MFFKGLVVSLFAATVLLAPGTAAALTFKPAAGSPVTQAAPDDVVNNFVAGDLNEDGYSDIASVGETNKIFVELGGSGGIFTAATGSPFGTGSPTTTGRSMIEAADLNGDNHLDLLVNGSRFPVQFETYLGAGDGTFPASPSFTVTLPYGQPDFMTYVDYSSPSIRDLNHDGKLDFVVGMFQHGFNVAIGDGDGSFTDQAEPVYVPTPRSVDSDPLAKFDAMVSIATGDYNGDGDPDVAMVMQQIDLSGSGVYLAYGEGDGTFAPDDDNPVMEPDPGSSLRSVATIDLNGDIYDDLSLTQPSFAGNDKVRTMLGGIGGPVINPGQGSVSPGYFPFEQAVADIDSSGQADIIAGLRGDSAAAVITTDGTGGISLAPGSPFAFPPISGNDFSVNNVAVADFNGDGAIDIAGDSSHSGSDPQSLLQARGIDVLLASAAASAAPAQVNFPDTPPSQSSAVVPVTLTNDGVPVLDLSTTTIGGAGASQFTIASGGTCDQTLAGGNSCTVNLKFTPSAPGNYSATLDLTFGDGVSAVSVPLTGSTPASATVDPVEGSYGEVISGYAPGAKTVAFRIKSTGNVNLDLGSPVLQGFDADDYQLADPGACINGIPSGQTCQIEATFKPAADSSGFREAQIKFPDANVSDPIEIPLGGYARKAEYSVTPAAKNFGKSQVGSGGNAPQTFTLTSTGAGPVPFNGASLTGPDAASFAIKSNDCPAMIEVEASCEIKVYFDPMTGPAGVRHASLEIKAFSSTVPGTASLALTGTATNPSSSGKPKLSLGIKSAKKVKRGKTLAVRATVKNTGKATARSIQLKTTVPGKLAKRPKVIRVESLAAGRSITRTIRVRVKKSARKGNKLKIRVTVGARGLSPKIVRHVIRVR